MTEVVKVHARLAPQAKVEPVKVASVTMAPAKAKHDPNPSPANIKADHEVRKKLAVETMRLSSYARPADPLPHSIMYTIYQKVPAHPTPYDRIVVLATTLGRMERRQEITDRTAKAARKHLKAADAKRMAGMMPEAMEALDNAEALLDAAEAAL